jgi:aryl-alcohol dehydrogenase
VLWRQGRFPFDELSKFYSLDQINEAFGASAVGGTISPIIGSESLPTTQEY